MLSPAKKKSGTSHLTFAGSEDKFNGILGGDNRGSQFTGKNDFFFEGNVNSVFKSGDTTGIQSMTTNKSNRMYFLNVNHQQPLGSNGTQLRISDTYARSNPGLILAPLNILGKAHIFSNQISHPLVRSRLTNFYLNLKLDVIHNNMNILNTPIFSDRISSLRFGFLYDKIDACSGLNTIDFTLSRGLKIFGASHKNNLNLSRPNGRSDYTKVALQISRIQKLPEPFSVLIAFHSQYALNRLLSAEQFTYGGSIYGRAYNASTLTGDDGLTGKLELRYTQQLSYKMCKNTKLQFTLNTIEYYTFYDYGIVWKPLPLANKTHEDGSSVGLGARTNFGNIYAYTELAKPLIHVITSDQNYKNNFRLFLGIFYKF